MSFLLRILMEVAFSLILSILNKQKVTIKWFSFINWLQGFVVGNAVSSIIHVSKYIEKFSLLCPNISITCRRFKDRRFDAFFKPKGLPVKENTLLLVEVFV